VNRRFCDKKGRDYAIASEVGEGDVLVTDNGFPCINEGQSVKIHKDCEGNLYFYCGEFSNNKHPLSEQLAGKRGYEDFYIGLYRRLN
jgi:hypothetical protein